MRTQLIEKPQKMHVSYHGGMLSFFHVHTITKVQLELICILVRPLLRPMRK